MHAFPNGVQFRPQVEAMPLGFLEKREPFVGKRKVVVQAADGDGTVLRQQLIDEAAPIVSVPCKRIAIVRKRQRHDALSEHVRNAAKRNSGARLPAIIEYHVGVSLPAIGVREYLNPVRRVKDAAWRLADEFAP